MLWYQISITNTQAMETNWTKLNKMEYISTLSSTRKNQIQLNEDNVNQCDNLAKVENYPLENYFCCVEKCLCVCRAGQMYHARENTVEGIFSVKMPHSKEHPTKV